jgi:uncharacterized protein (DUF1684 family)
VDSYNDGLNYSIAFKDLTNGVETYGGGRVVDGKVDTPLNSDESLSVTVDFNKAYHLPCAINSHVKCPAVPSGNCLGFKVEAGEMLPFQG